MEKSILGKNCIKNACYLKYKLNNFFTRSGVPRLIPQNRQKTESRLETRKQINTIVAISDVKSKDFLDSQFNLKIIYNLSFKTRCRIIHVVREILYTRLL